MTGCTISIGGGVLSSSEYDKLKKEIKTENKSDLYMTRLIVILGTKCSLNCKECNNLMPHFKPQIDLPQDEIINSLNNVINVSKSILICELIGGEPFLSKNFKTLLERVINEDKIKQIEITTNATIIPNKDLIELLQNKKVIVKISDYGELVNKDKLIDFLKENEINYEVLKITNWISSGGIEKRNKDHQALHEEYSNCSPGIYCKALFGDKLFQCARAASLYALGYMKENEYIDCKNLKSSEELKDFILRDWSVACDYCDQGLLNKKFIKTAEQIPRN